MCTSAGTKELLDGHAAVQRGLDTLPKTAKDRKINTVPIMHHSIEVTLGWELYGRERG